jgi:hypothetical protein
MWCESRDVYSPPSSEYRFLEACGGISLCIYNSLGTSAVGAITAEVQ